MSLVYVFVKLSNGTYAADPVVFGDGWFVCFDDDDPPEFVVSKARARTKAEALSFAASTLDNAGIPWRNMGAPSSGAERDFGREGQSFKFEPAHAIFFELTGPLPTMCALQHDGILKKPRRECVVYGEPTR